MTFMTRTHYEIFSNFVEGIHTAQHQRIRKTILARKYYYNMHTAVRLNDDVNIILLGSYSNSAFYASQF